MDEQTVRASRLRDVLLDFSYLNKNQVQVLLWEIFKSAPLRGYAVSLAGDILEYNKSGKL